MPLLDQVVGSVRRPLWILLRAVGFVLLIACANVANLMLARALARAERVRGAHRARRQPRPHRGAVVGRERRTGGAWRLRRPALAAVAVEELRSLQPANVPRLPDIAIDGSVLTFTIGVSLVTAILFGLAPALGAGRLGVSGALNASARGSTAAGGFGAKRLNYRFALVVGELSLSLVLLVGAGLLIRSFAKLQNVSPGFDRRGVLSFELMMAGRRYTDPQAVRNAYQRLWTELDRLPGVVASGGVTSLPLSGFFAWGPITIEGRTPPVGEKFINADQRVVSGRYFEAMGIPLERGRLFDAGDAPDKPRVAIVDERMAEEFWPGGDPIAKRIRNGDVRSTAPWITIVGVVGRVKRYPRQRQPDRILRAAVAGDRAIALRRCEESRRSCRAGTGRRSGRSNDRSGSARLSRADGRRDRPAIDVGPAVRDVVADVVCRDRARPGADRDQRRDVLPRVAQRATSAFAWRSARRIA